jgi:site-specific recombinase XerD
MKTETIRKYKLIFKQLESFAETNRIKFAEDLGLDELTAFRATWKGGPLSSSKKLERLRSIFKFALKRKWVKENFAADLKRTKITDKPTLPFDEEQMKAIFTAAKTSKRYGATRPTHSY